MRPSEERYVSLKLPKCGLVKNCFSAFSSQSIHQLTQALAWCPSPPPFWQYLTPRAPFLPSSLWFWEGHTAGSVASKPRQPLPTSLPPVGMVGFLALLVWPEDIPWATFMVWVGERCLLCLEQECFALLLYALSLPCAQGPGQGLA